MKKIFFISLLFVFVLSGAVFASSERQDERRLYVLTDSAVYKAMLGVKHEFKGAFSTNGVKRAKALEKLGLIKTEEVEIFTISAPNNCGDGVCQGNESPTTCEIDCGSSSGTTDRTYYPSEQYPYGIKMVNGGTGGTGVKVAVLDTGLYREHLDLDHVECIETLNQTVSTACDDGHGHGTHVAGTVLANGGNDGSGIFGVAPSADLLVVKVLFDDGNGYGDDVAMGIIEATNRGANIISMSLGSTVASDFFHNAVKYANDNGVLLVAASGNYKNGDETMHYPGAYPEVVGVGAIDSSSKVAYFSVPGFANDGNDSTIVEGEIEFAAPGVSVESTYLNSKYVTANGTSMATPHISGLAAKLWKGTALDTRLYLRSLAVDKGDSGYDIYTGYGMPVAPVLSCLEDEIECDGACRLTVCGENIICDDDNPDTPDTCLNPDTCEAVCEYKPIETTCPDGEIECGGACKLPLCSVDSDCNDSDSSTTDTCLNPDTCEAVCEYKTVETAVCGNKVCEAGETWSTCPRDCKR